MTLESHDVEINDETGPNIVDDDFEGQHQDRQEEDKTESRKPEFTEEEREQYGKKVQRRIDKLTAEIYQERQEKALLHQRLEEVEKRFQEKDANERDQDVNNRLAELRKKRVEAYDSGEYEKVTEFDEEVIELKLKQHEPKQPRQEQHQVQQQQPAAIPEAQQAWLSDNDWYYSPFKIQNKAKVDETYLGMLQEGYDPNDADTYAELDKRITGVKPKRNAPPPVSSVDRGGNVAGSQKGKFSDSDKLRMREFGLDPNNETHRAEWLRNKGA